MTAANDPISRADVERVARLARLELTEDELVESTTRLAATLGYIDRLNQLDLTGVEPLSNPLDATNRTDDDTPRPGLSIETLTTMAPASFPPFVKVPKVLGDAGWA